MTWLKNNKVIALILALSFVCTAFLIGARIGEESANKNISMIMKYRDVFKYAEAANIEMEEALADFASVGVSGIIIENFWYFFSEKEIQNVRSAGMEPILKTVRDLTVEQYDELVKKFDIKYPLLFTYRYLDGDAESYLNDNKIALALVEDKMQTGHELIRHFDLDENNVSMVRVFELVKSYASRYAVLGYEGAEEIENVLYRAVTDRNIRILWITPFYDSRTGELITDIEEYRGVFENLAKRIKPHGMIIGDTFSTVEEYIPSHALMIGCFFGISALSVLLLGTLFALSSKLRLAYTLVLGILSSCAYFVMRGLSLKVMAFVIVSVMPCLAVYVLLLCSKRFGKTKPAFGKCMLLSLGVLALIILILLIGGSFVGAVLGNSRYMLEFEMFRGVKLSQMIPLVYTVVLIAKEFVYKKGKSLHSIVLDLGQNASRSKKLIIVLGIVCILGTTALFIVRTGNTILQAGELEQKFRIFFEVTCVARPRTKEFIIAWPALLCGMLLFSRDHKVLGSVALFAASIGCASVCNTFCHIRAYYLLSVIRTFYGVGIGVAIGLVLMCVLWFFLKLVSAKSER